MRADGTKLCTRVEEGSADVGPVDCWHLCTEKVTEASWSWLGVSRQEFQSQRRYKMPMPEKRSGAKASGSAPDQARVALVSQRLTSADWHLGRWGYLSEVVYTWLGTISLGVAGFATYSHGLTRGWSPGVVLGFASVGLSVFCALVGWWQARATRRLGRRCGLAATSLEPGGIARNTSSIVDLQEHIAAKSANMDEIETMQRCSNIVCRIFRECSIGSVCGSPHHALILNDAMGSSLRIDNAIKFDEAEHGKAFHDHTGDHPVRFTKAFTGNRRDSYIGFGEPYDVNTKSLIVHFGMEAGLCVCARQWALEHIGYSGTQQVPGLCYTTISDEPMDLATPASWSDIEVFLNTDDSALKDFGLTEEQIQDMPAAVCHGYAQE
ncbi:unnamed protein product [Prorocentrum cordatum]|uniref:Uncharacterized protein n=1 Tax=Prorocentrum cordatum TaxID=2364126 RepID=A0ABN9SY18_9DINO|nr:unnamed protein product [Polarella glacialis]